MKNKNRTESYWRTNSLELFITSIQGIPCFFEIFIPEYFIFFSLLLKNIVNFHYAKTDKVVHLLPEDYKFLYSEFQANTLKIPLFRKGRSSFLLVISFDPLESTSRTLFPYALKPDVSLDFHTPRDQFKRLHKELHINYHYPWELSYSKTNIHFKS
jgi:hypothetical protein